MLHARGFGFERNDRPGFVLMGFAIEKFRNSQIPEMFVEQLEQAAALLANMKPQMAAAVCTNRRFLRNRGKLAEIHVRATADAKQRFAGNCADMSFGILN